MDHIKQAIAKARASQTAGVRAPLSAPQPLEEREAKARALGSELPTLELNPRHLELNRIVAHLPHDPMAVGFDILRTRVLQEMQQRKMRTLLVTSPTMACGKTVTSINLAIALARRLTGFCVLADCDFRKPQIANYLGFKPDRDLYDIVTGEATIPEVMRSISIAGPDLGILATRSAAPQSSEVLSSMAMKNVVSAIKSLSADTIAIFDAPPMLIADDVQAFMPLIDGVLLVVAPGESTYAQVENCLLNIPEEKLIGPVITKSAESAEQTYQYY